MIKRKGLNELFRLRDRIFFRKKKPHSEAYPFTVVDPFEVFGDETLYGDFNLVGDDWYDKSSDKPVAILWGFNNWKWGFVSAYLPEYRTAFAPRKIISFTSLSAIGRFPLKPQAFVFWGYNEPKIVKWYAQRNNIKIFRMEDGFIRSSSLGASHSTPYSLLIDAKGLHYNPEEVSDIEEILNNQAFSDEDLDSAKRCLDLMQSLRLSKYNQPSLGTENQRIIKIRKRVAVLGQVDNDMSVRLGNPDRWSMIELIRLAKLEHPDADILYRAHPDVYQGYQRSAFRKRAVEKICELTSPDVPLVDFLDTVDHVYTITSLTGLEALLRGKKVTVVGAAFYAGWGLTDDRIKFPRRTTKRTLLELFAGVYLKYPRYLADLKNSETGFHAACLRILVDTEIGKFELFKKQQANTINEVQLLSRSDYWPQLLFQKQLDENELLVESAMTLIDHPRALGNRPGRMFQIVYIYSLCGACKSDTSRDMFISAVRNIVDLDVLNFLLLDLSEVHPGAYLAKQFAWLLGEVNDNSASLSALKSELERSRTQVKSLNQEVEKIANTDGFTDASRSGQAEKTKLSDDQATLLFEMYDQYISLRKIEDAVKIAKTMLLSGYFVNQMVPKLAKLAELKFDYASAKEIAKFGQIIDLYQHNRNLALVEARGFTERDALARPIEFVHALVKLVVLKPDRFNDAVFLAVKFSENLKFKNPEILFRSILMLDNEHSIRKALGFIAAEEPVRAVRILEKLIVQGINSDSLRVAYSKALSYSGRIHEAIAVMEEARKVEKTSANYRESLRLFVIMGMYERSLHLLRDAQHRKIDLGDMHPRKVYFGNRMVAQAFETFRDLSIKEAVATYYPEKYFHFGRKALETNRLFALSIFGPGDEIRFASIYNLFPSRLVQKNIAVSCEPRLMNILTRSFKDLTFVPVPRPRDSEYFNPNNYTKVLGSDLMRVIDNTATDVINDYDHVMMVTDMLVECMPSYAAFPGKAYLRHDESLSNVFRSRLPEKLKLIGLSWRSSLTTHSRNEHYLTVEELAPLFSVEGVQFVNFQYDECQAELDWIESRYPGKVIHLSDVDHYNDFDSVAALMKCMDLMIAPATTVVELAGALGCPTWLLSNSSELHWRKIDERGTDVWHNSVTHIEGTVLGDKSSLVDQLLLKLSEFVRGSELNECVV